MPDSKTPYYLPIIAVVAVVAIVALAGILAAPRMFPSSQNSADFTSGAADENELGSAFSRANPAGGDTPDDSQSICESNNNRHWISPWHGEMSTQKCCGDDIGENHNYKAWGEQWDGRPFYDLNHQACCDAVTDCVGDTDQCYSQGHVLGPSPHYLCGLGGDGRPNGVWRRCGTSTGDDPVGTVRHGKVCSQQGSGYAWVNANPDNDQTACTNQGKTWMATWRGETGTTQSCCGGSGEVYRFHQAYWNGGWATGQSPTSTDDPTNNICCNNANDCVGGGGDYPATFCVDTGTISSTNEQHLCDHGKWYTCEGVAIGHTKGNKICCADGWHEGSMCDAPVDPDTAPGVCQNMLKHWISPWRGETGTTQSCCGDDTPEYFRWHQAYWNGDWVTLSQNSDDNACCNSNTDCIGGGTNPCVTSGATPTNQYLCSSGRWYACQGEAIDDQKRKAGYVCCPGGVWRAGTSC